MSVNIFYNKLLSETQHNILVYFTLVFVVFSIALPCFSHDAIVTALICSSTNLLPGISTFGLIDV